METHPNSRNQAGHSARGRMNATLKISPATSIQWKKPMKKKPACRTSTGRIQSKGGRESRMGFIVGGGSV